MPAKRKGKKVSQKRGLNARKKDAPVATVAAVAATTTRKRKAMSPPLADDLADGSSSPSDSGSGGVSDDDGSDFGVRGSGRKKDGGKGEGKGKGKAIAQVTIDSGSDEDQEEEEEDDMQWEDVLNVISAPEAPGATGAGPSSTPNPKRDLELTLNHGKTGLSSSISNGKKRKGASAAERQIRLVTHCLHVQYLLFHGSIRNRWLCDPELQAILLSHLSPSLLLDVERLQKKQGKLPPAGKSPRAADPALQVLDGLMHWWKKRFTITRPGLRKNGYKLMSQFVIERDEVLANRLKGLSEGADGGFKFTTGRTDERGEPVHTIFRDEGERVESLQEFREMARECNGSRDVGAMFFTALLRALGFEARMVFSLQPLGFGFTERETFSGKVRAVVGDSGGGPEGEGGRVERSGEVVSEKKMKGNGKKAATGKPARKPSRRSPRKLARKRQRLDVEFPSSGLESESEWSGDTEGEEEDDEGVFIRKGGTKKKTPIKKQPPEIEPTTIDQDLPYPIFWTEVYSPTTSTWITIDPLVLTALGSAPDLLSKFEPKGKNAVESKRVIAYVLAYSDNGTAKDVTVRYLAKNAFPGKTKGFRILPSEVPVYDIEGKIVAVHKRDWFGNVMRGYQARGKLMLERDVKEDEELVGVAATETKSFAGNGKESIGWYKDHPEYILERHLKRDEAISPGRLHVKIFVSGKGEKAKDEKVYARQDVVSCKSVENWYREGRVIKEGEQALKKVKPRAATLNRKREIEDAQRDGETVLQGLYSLGQTEEYMPPEIVNGEIPRNKYGNIDIYTQSMIPAGAVHLPLRGSARVAKKLKISYADAVIGFEFKNQRAAPYIDGIVIAAENEDVVREAWEEDQVQRKIKEDEKREKAALTLWRRFIVGLRIVQRLHEVYGDDDGIEEVNPFTAKRFRGKGKAAQVSHGEEGGGGFVNDDASADGEPGGFTRGNEDEDIEMSGGGGGFLLDVEEDPSDKAPVKKNSIPTQAMSMKEMLAQKQKVAQSIFDSEEEPEDALSSQEAKSSYFVNQTPPTTRKKAGKEKPVVVVVVKKPAKPTKKNPKRKVAPKTGTRSRHFVHEPGDGPEDAPEVFTPRRSLRKRG